MENRLITCDDERPAGRPGECFYCKEPLGHLHDPFCVIVACRPVAVTLTDTKTGKQRVYDTEEYFPKDGWSDYLWTDGNYSCDCNRYLFFQRADGKTPSLGKAKCGEGRYLVNSIVLKDTGEQLYSEVDA